MMTEIENDRFHEILMGRAPEEQRDCRNFIEQMHAAYGIPMVTLLVHLQKWLLPILADLKTLGVRRTVEYKQATYDLMDKGEPT